MKIRIERAGNRIYLASDRPTQVKSHVPGAYWSDSKKVWSLPLEMTVCYALREAYGNRLEIGPNLTAWARAEKAKRAQAIELAGSADAELKLLPEVAPVLAQAMSNRTYQRVAARFVADTEGRDGRRRALIGDTVGLGKTAEALGAVLESGVPGPFLIICPKTAVGLAWTPEIRRWLPDDEIITIPDGKAARDNTLNNLLARNRAQQARGFHPDLELTRTWVVIHPAAIRTQSWWECLATEEDIASTRTACNSRTKFRAGVVTELDCGHPKKDRTVKTIHEHVFPQLFDVEWGAVVVDESQQILIRLTGTPNLQRRGAEMIRDLVRPGGVRIAMSGTPFRSKPHQIWSTLNWLDPVRFSAKWRFIQTYWETENGFYGGINLKGMREDREELLESELSDIMIRRTRKQVRPDLPDRNYGGSPLNGTDGPMGVWLPMEGAQLKAYKQMAETGVAQLNGGRISPVGILAELTRLRQFAGAEGELRGGEFWPLAKGNKYDWLVSFLQEIGYPEEPAAKVVVVSQFTKYLEVFRAGLQKEFKEGRKIPEIGVISGNVTQRVREQTVERFETAGSGLDLIFLQTITGGAAITLDAAEVMIFLDETFVDDDQEQAEGRIDNRNPERKIVPRMYYYLRSLDSIDEQIAVANAEAKAAGGKLLDGGPLALARKVLR
jgi:SNF2 family DNA or RNA helicase